MNSRIYLKKIETKSNRAITHIDLYHSCSDKEPEGGIEKYEERAVLGD
jgi:hypothetical protein